MTNQTRRGARRAAAKYDWQSYKASIDVGGGSRRERFAYHRGWVEFWRQDNDPQHSKRFAADRRRAQARMHSHAHQAAA